MRCSWARTILPPNGRHKSSPRGAQGARGTSTLAPAVCLIGRENRSNIFSNLTPRIDASHYTNAVLASPTHARHRKFVAEPIARWPERDFHCQRERDCGPAPGWRAGDFQGWQQSSGTGTLSNRTASFSTSTLTVKTHSISASYAGDNNYLPSKSAKRRQVVNP
jgi:hypothetical protein